MRGAYAEFSKDPWFVEVLQREETNRQQREEEENRRRQEEMDEFLRQQAELDAIQQKKSRKKKSKSSNKGGYDEAGYNARFFSQIPPPPPPRKSFKSSSESNTQKDPFDLNVLIRDSVQKSTDSRELVVSDANPNSKADQKYVTDSPGKSSKSSNPSLHAQVLRHMNSNTNVSAGEVLAGSVVSNAKGKLIEGQKSLTKDLDEMYAEVIEMSSNSRPSVDSLLGRKSFSSRGSGSSKNSQHNEADEQNLPEEPAEVVVETVEVDDKIFIETDSNGSEIITEVVTTTVTKMVEGDEESAQNSVAESGPSVV